jgi:hypothetical protein
MALLVWLQERARLWLGLQAVFKTKEVFGLLFAGDAHLGETD